MDSTIQDTLDLARATMSGKKKAAAIESVPSRMHNQLKCPRIVAQAVQLPTDSALNPAHVSNAQAYEDAGFYKSAHWSADGSTILTNSEDNTLKTFVLPETLLDGDNHDVQPYSTISNPGPVYSLALYPGFQLSNTGTTILVTSTRDHPIRLHNALYPSLMASYPLINPTTEAFIAPHSLTFTNGGTHIIAGSDSLISCFDLQRPGQEPLRSYPTIPSKRKKIVGGGVGMKGIVSCLAINRDYGILAAGTFTRCVGLYSDEGRGEAIGVFSLGMSGSGSGITQAEWSPDGRYLYVAERMSTCVQVYDLRMDYRLLGELRGREARTNQRVGIDVQATSDGHRIVGGGTDGVVRIWAGADKMVDGVCEPVAEYKVHEDTIGSTLCYPGDVNLVATCSGSRLQDEDEDEDGRDSDRLSHQPDYSLRIWDL